MLALALLLALTFAPPGPEGICPDDALRFGVQPEVAHLCYAIACEHALSESLRWAVRESNPPEVYEQWREEVVWRRQCWTALEDLLYYTWRDDRQKTEKLRELRRLLGPEDYHAGRMPAPTPSYR